MDADSPAFEVWVGCSAGGFGLAFSRGGGGGEGGFSKVSWRSDKILSKSDPDAHDPQPITATETIKSKKLPLENRSPLRLIVIIFYKLRKV